MSEPVNRLSFPKLARKVFFFIHLWLGLILGTYLVLEGLTGSILVFRPEIDLAANSRLMRVEAPSHGAPLSLDQISDDFYSRFPGAFIGTITLPEDKTRSYVIDYLPANFNTPGALPKGARISLWQAFINPYNGQILGTRVQDGAFFQTIRRFHKDFLLDTFGTKFSRYAVFGAIALLISGVWIWFPPLQFFGKLFIARTTIKRGASAPKLLLDWHNASGFYSSALLLVLCVTGAAMFWWPQTRSFVNKAFAAPASYAASHSDAPSERQPSGAPLTPGEPLENAVKTANIVAPGLPVTQIRPGKKTIRVIKASSLSHGVKPWRVTVLVSAADGEARGVEKPTEGSLAQRILGWIVPVHFGVWGYGLAYYPIKFITFLVGFAPLILMVTGVLLYIRKARQKRAA